MSYPISRGKLVNFGTFISNIDREGELIDGPTVVEVTNDETIEPFADWEPEVKALLQVQHFLSLRSTSKIETFVCQSAQTNIRDGLSVRFVDYLIMFLAVLLC